MAIMIDFISYILTGVLVGLAIGMTGVGGGSLMTPMLLMFGFPTHIAIGTDLMYVSIAKSLGVAVHAKKKNINWQIVGLLALGSVPSSILTIYLLSKTTEQSFQHIHTALGFMLLITAFVILFRSKLALKNTQSQEITRKKQVLLFLSGLCLGAMVTLTSVGAGAIGTALLFILFPWLAARNVVGTDLAHAVPLTFIAGLGHVAIGNVDYLLLLALLIGSLPAIYLGSHLSSYIPNRILQSILAAILVVFGIKYLFF